MEDFVCNQSCKTEDKCLYSHDEEVLGVQCRTCGQEWLKKQFLYTKHQKDSDCPKVVFRCKRYDTDLFKAEKPELPIDTAFQIQPNRSVCENDDTIIKSLKIGDHIAWERPHVIYHHAIIVEFGEDKTMAEVIHWSKTTGGTNKMKILTERLDLRKQEGKLFRINYSTDVNICNPVELVKARAYSRLGDTGYHFFIDNCESFATYCKTGVAQSHQYHWLLRKFYDSLKSTGGCAFRMVKNVNWADVIGKIAKYTIPEVAEKLSPLVENLPLAAPYVSAVIILAFEMYFFISNRNQIYNKYKRGEITAHDCKRCMVERVFEFVFTAGLAVAGSFIPGFIFGVIGAFCGAMLGRIGGKCVGRFFAGLLG